MFNPSLIYQSIVVNISNLPIQEEGGKHASLLHQIGVGIIYTGAQKLTGENLKVAWAEFSTLS